MNESHQEALSEEGNSNLELEYDCDEDITLQVRTTLIL